MTVTTSPEKETLTIGDPIFCKSLRYYFREYCNCSSIHGFRYFGEKRSYFERIWWFVVFSLVLGGCIYAINGVYQKWSNAPVIVSFDTSETPIYSIPFPAVTICPESKSIQSLYNHSDIVSKLIRKEPLNKTEELHANYMSMLCDRPNRLSRQSATFTDEFFEFLNSVRRKNILQHCWWMSDEFKCDDLFVPILTDEGICYTFNMLDRDDLFNDNVVHFQDFLKQKSREVRTWDPNVSMTNYANDQLEAYPRRAKFPGVKNALKVTMVTYTEDIDPVCKDSLQGFKVLLHLPIRVPRPSSQYFRVPLDEAVLGAVQPVMMTTSKIVQKYPPKKRQCYYPGERKLKYFQIYTQLNCNLECLTNLTLKYCRCVAFYMPRDNSTDICGDSKRLCTDRAEKYLQTVGLKRSLQDFKKKKGQAKNETEKPNESQDKDVSCDCMPICSDISYSVETSQAKWGWRDKLKIVKPTTNFKKYHKSSLTLYFKTSQFVTSKRHELYGRLEFLANFGGLLGLFTGFSVLSIIELLYFLTIRWCCNIRLYGKWYEPGH